MIMSRINQSFQSIWEDHTPRLILADASGVLYTDDDQLSGVGHTIQQLSAKVPVWVATNNTSHSIPEIVNHLISRGIHIPASQIISSGLGLSVSPQLRPLISGKSVYTYGCSTSSWYVNIAGGHSVDHPDDAAVIVLASSTGASTKTAMAMIHQSLTTNPRPVICVNPDHYVQTGSGLYPVIGYYAAQLAQSLSIELLWMGKPFPSFSEVVRHFLTEAGIALGPDIWFFDDNPQNVAQMTQDLGISGATVMDTGLCKHLSLAEIQTQFSTIPAIRIPSLLL